MIWIGVVAYAAIGLFFVGRMWTVSQGKWSLMFISLLLGAVWPATMLVSWGLHSAGGLQK